MLKHNDRISLLSDDQKVRLLTGIGNLSSKEMKILGIPEMRFGDMKDYGRNIIPNATSLSNAWDVDLWKRVAEEKAATMLEDGLDLVLIPGPKIKLSPYRREISEDPYLASRFSEIHRKTAVALGATVAENGYYLTDPDVKWMDEHPNERVLGELVAMPYRESLTGGGVRAVVTDDRALREEYRESCRTLHKMLDGNVDYLLAKNASEENTVRLISNGIICLEGSENALSQALQRYKKLKRSIEKNEGATREQLALELESGNAISPEQLDEALDRLLDFIDECKKKHSELDYDSDFSLDYDAIVSSTVLLKNKNGVLPLALNKKIAVIGNIISSDDERIPGYVRVKEELELRGYNCIGAESGYNRDCEISEGSVTRATALAQKADVVLLFLGQGYENEKKIPKTEKLSIPADQLCLAEAIANTGAKVVTVLSSGHAPDVEFTRSSEALLFAPLEVQHSAAAIVSILCGENNPSGKLAYTLYSGSDKALMKGIVYKNKHGMKSGPFVGYRYYDTAELTVGYPFGHGLSYTDFKYSGIAVESGMVSFYVENVGDYPGVEIAEIYVGAENSPVIRPKKELCGFEKISLMPGEKKKVTLAVKLSSIYQDEEFFIPTATYTVYIGSSVSDIRLQKEVIYRGEDPSPDGERLSDYLQSVSNVKEDNYTLEANYSIMKKSIKNILFGVAFVILAISVAVFNSITEYPSLFVGAVAGILAIISVIFFVAEVMERSRNYEEERAKIDEANNESFADAEQIPFMSSDKMFRDEFDTHDVQVASAEEIAEFDADEAHKHTDKSFTALMAAEEMRAFLTAGGYKMGDFVLENLLASMASSALTVTMGVPSEDFVGVVRALCDYFGADTFIDSAEKKNEGDNNFFSYDYHGDHSKKSLLLALEYARDNPTKTVIAAIDGVDASTLEEYLAPFTKYLYSRKANNRITVANEMGASVTYNIAPNLQLLVNLDRNTSIDMIPSYISMLGAFCSLEFVRCQKEEHTPVVRELNRYQLAYFADKESKSVGVTEDTWKKIDKIEKYAQRFSDYRFGNKLWNGFEKHIGILLATNMELVDAIDVSVATRLLPSVSVAIKDKLTGDDQTLSDTLEFVLGEEKADYSKRFLERNVFVPEVIEEVVPEASSVAEDEAEENESVEEAHLEQTDNVAEEVAEEENEDFSDEEDEDVSEDEESEESDESEVESEE